MKKLILSTVIVFASVFSFANDASVTVRQFQDDYQDYIKKLSAQRLAFHRQADSISQAYEKKIEKTKTTYLGIGAGTGVAVGLFLGITGALLFSFKAKMDKRSKADKDKTAQPDLVLQTA